LKSAWIELLRVLHPAVVKNISIEDEVIPHRIVRSMIRFAFIYLLVFAIGSIVMSFLGLDMVSAMSSTATTLAGAGPGLGLVGPTESFAFLNPAAKIVLSALMFLGRLEILTVMMVFTPDFWKS